MSLENIPYDVLMEIVAALENDNTDESPQLSDIQTLSLTSKSIRQVVLPRLFKSIEWEFPRRSSLPPPPNITLVPLTKELLLRSTALRHPFDMEWTPVILTFRNLTRLTLQNLTLSSSIFTILSSFRKLDILIWKYCSIEDSVAQIAGMTSSPLKISELSVATPYCSSFLPLNSIQWETLSSLTIEGPHAYLSQCKALKTLILDFVPDWGALMNTILELSELDTLHINDGVQMDSQGYALPPAIPLFPKLLSLRCPIAVVTYFQGSPLLEFGLISDDDDFDITVSLPPFDTLLHLLIPPAIFRHLGDTSLKSLYPNLRSLVVDQPVISADRDVRRGAVLLEDDVISLVSYAHVFPPIHSLVFSDTVGRTASYNLVHQHRLISEQLSPAIPSLRTVQLDEWTKCTWTKETLPLEGGESEEPGAKAVWKPYIPRRSAHFIQRTWMHRTDFHDYDNCFTRLLALNTLPASERSPDGLAWNDRH
jgi:hypothetical protein